MLVLLVPVAAIVALAQLRGAQDVVVVDPAPVFDQARAAAFPVDAPGPLAGWTSVSAVFHRTDAGAILRVGYVTPRGGQLQLIESTEPVADLLRRELGNKGEAETATVEGRSWQSYAVRGDELALVFTASGRTLIVVGRADLDELKMLVSTLD